MKKKLIIALLGGTLLSGCYTHICPTYAIKPEKKQESKAAGENTPQKEQKKSI